MNTKRRIELGLLSLCAALGWPAAAARAEAPAHGAVAVTVLVPSGLNNPRGLRFGPDGHLYVAEGGTGGTNSTAGQCEQVVPPVGPYTGSETGGRISRIDVATGTRTTVTDTLPSSQTSVNLGNLVSGVADIDFIDGQLYALLAGAGCSHGVTGLPNGIVKVNADGTWKLVANLSAFQQAHPVAAPNPGDFEPDGTWWSMVAVRGALYAVEPNHGEMVRVTTDGRVTRVIDISAAQGHVVPTSIAYHGNFYVSALGTFDPDQLNAQSVFKITPSGRLAVVATGLSKVLGMTFDARANLYVLETSFSTTDPGPAPGTGRLLRIRPNGQQDVLVDSTSGLLTFPTGMAFGPDGALYVGNVGFGPPPIGLGQILRIEIPDAH